jgi:DNA mismatch repair ATPase MutS
MIMANTMDRLSLLERQAVRVEMRMDRLSERSNLLKVQQLMVFIAGIVVLELVKLADTCPDIRNEHFREDVVDGAMVFDYVLRQGPSPTRNALKIMEMEGLPVKWDAADRILRGQ